MIALNKAFYNSTVTLRVTALWAFSEAFMGGILHGLAVPFSGLVLSFVASVCITLIALGKTKKGEILKATLLVIAIKFILSPYTPPMAYAAVIIQGAVGELLFLNKKNEKAAAFFLSLISLVYSAFQQLLVLTVVFGRGLWQAIDIFLNKVTQSFIKDSVHYSFYIILFYISCYLIAGIAGGLLNIKIIKSVQCLHQTGALMQQVEQLPSSGEDVFTTNQPANRKKKPPFLFGCLMLLLLLLSYLPFFKSGFGKLEIPELILRGIIILLVWKYFITPLLYIQLQKWLAGYKEKNSNALQQVITLLPGIKTILQQSWQLSQQPKKGLRFKKFINNTVLLIVHHEP